MTIAMTMKNRALRLSSRCGLVSIAIALSLSACDLFKSASDVQTGQFVGGATVQVKDVQPVGGFLPHPELLQPGAAGQPALNYRNPNASFSAYNSIMLDHVTLWSAPGSPLSAVPPDQQQAAVNLFYSDLYDALQKHCRLVTIPVPGTVRFRFAIVDAKIPNATINTVATYAPYVSGVYNAASYAFNNGVGYFAGAATAEGYAVDAMTGTLLWEGVDKRGGTTAAVENTFNTWLDIHHAFENWSSQMVTKMQQQGVCKS